MVWERKKIFSFVVVVVVVAEIVIIQMNKFQNVIPLLCVFMFIKHIFVMRKRSDKESV